MLTRVDIELSGGPLSGEVVEAQRDELGRVPIAVWVRRSPDGQALIVRVEPDVSTEQPAAAHYQFENWRQQNPVYRFLS